MTDEQRVEEMAKHLFTDILNYVENDYPPIDHPISISKQDLLTIARFVLAEIEAQKEKDAKVAEQHHCDDVSKEECENHIAAAIRSEE